MFTDTFSLILGFCTGASVLLFFLTVLSLDRMVPEENRDFMDPLPPLLRFIWPLVRVIAYFICARLPYSYLQQLETRLRKSGVSYLMMAEEYVSLRFISSCVALLFGYLSLRLLGHWNPILFLVLPLVGYFYPDIWTHDIRKRQVDEVLRTLPAYLDFVVIAVQAGLNFSGAIEQARKKGPGGPLKNEFGVILRDLRSGIKRTHALQRMARRLDIHEVTSFVNAVVQAERMGASMAGVLKIQAEQRRNERFQRAEKKAMEAPVKLMGPLVLFIFPTTFIILAFPLVMKFLHQGLM